MLATKENARVALSHIRGVRLDKFANARRNDEAAEFLVEFLNAAERKLPSQEAYEREKTRKRTGEKRRRAAKREKRLAEA